MLEKRPLSESPIEFSYLKQNHDARLVSSEVIAGESTLIIESAEGFTINVQLVPFDKVATLEEKVRLEAARFVSTDYYLANKIAIEMNGKIIDLTRMAAEISAKILVPKVSPVVDTSSEANQAIYDEIMEAMNRGEIVLDEVHDSLMQPREPLEPEQLGDLTEDEFLYTVRNFHLFSKAGSRELTTGERYILCPLPITVHGLFVFLHEYGHLIDPDDFQEIIKVYELGQKRRFPDKSLSAKIIGTERKADANAAILLRRLLRFLELPAPWQDTLRRAIQLNLYSYYSRHNKDDLQKALRKGEKRLTEQQANDVVRYR